MLNGIEISGNWFLEMAVLTASWVLLRWGDHKKTHPLRILCETVLLYAAILGGVLLCEALNAFIVNKSAIVLFHVLLSLTQGVIAALYLHITGAYSTMTRRLLWLGLHTASLSILAIAGQTSLLIINSTVDGSLYGAAVRLAIQLLIPVMAMYLRRFNFEEYDVIPASGFRVLLYELGCLFLFYVAEDVFFGFELSKCLILLAAYASMLLVTVASTRTMYSMCREHADKFELQMEKQRFLAERELSQATEVTLDTLCSIRHDLKNQYAFMRILLSEKRYDDLEAYFDNLAAHLPPQLAVIDCGNRAMNTILNMEAGKLRAEQVPFEYQLVVPPALPFKEAHLCGIIANLLDNACEECRRLIDAGDPNVKVHIEIVPHKSYLLIKCCNTTDRRSLEKTRDGIRTSKGDERTHGYGTRIVSKLAKRYNGMVDYSLKDGMFVAKVLLDMTEGSGNEIENRTV